MGVQGSARQLSPLDAAFLYFERPNQLLHVGCVALLEGSVPFDRLVATLGERLGTLPRYHGIPVRKVLDLSQATWQDDPHFDVRHHLRRVAAPPPGGDAELQELVATLFTTPFDRGHPLWETYLIEGLAGGRAALLSKVHHCMIDGVSGAQVLEAMTDGPAGGTAVPPPRPAPEGDGLLARVGRRALRFGETLVPSLPSARDALGAAALLASFVRDPVSTLPFNGTLSDARRIVWAAFPLDDFLVMRGAAACKVNDVVLAVIAGALRRYLERRGVAPEGLHVRALVPVSVRREAERLALGNLVSAMFATLPVGVADPGERLARIAHETRRLKEEGQARAFGALLGLAGALPTPFGALLGQLEPVRPFINTVCTNVPGPRDARSILGRRILDVHPIVPLGMGMGLGFAILSYADRLSIGVNADAALVPDADCIPALLEDSAREYAAVFGIPPPPPAVTEPVGPTVADLMTSDVVALGTDDTLADAQALMRARRIRHLPVLDPRRRLVGLLSHRDLLAASPSTLTFGTADRQLVLGHVHAAEVMETHLSTAAPDEPAAAAGRRMVRHKIGCLPVMRPDGALVGIVTEEDFLRWATERMAPA